MGRDIRFFGTSLNADDPTETGALLLEHSVSIIIPCYNAEHSVSRAIESALQQTYQNCEVIVVDDGSTDGSRAKIQSYSDSIRCETISNGGACIARNHGVTMAGGNYIQFLDADDEIHADKIHTQLPVVCDNPDAFVFTDGQMQQEGDSSDSQPFVREYCGGCLTTFLVRNNVQTSSPIHLKSDLQKISGFKPGRSCSQEYEMHLKLSQIKSTAIRIPKSLFTLHRQKQSVSSNDVRLMVERRNVVYELFQRLEQQSNITESIRVAIAERLAMDATKFKDLGERDHCLSNYRLARNVHAEGGLSVVYNKRSLAVAHRIVGPYNISKLVKGKSLLKQLFKLHR